MDIRYAFRTLARSPGFTVAALATIALGIGINTVVFTIYSAVAFRPLPVRDAGAVVRLGWNSADSASDQFSWSEYERLKGRARSFSQVIATSTAQSAICKLPEAGNGSGEVVRLRLVSGNYFSGLGIAPALGRLINDNDREAAVISYDFWKRKLKGDRDISGKALNVDGVALSVIGVAPKEFAGTGVPPQAPDLWIPGAAKASILPGIDWSRDDPREWQVLARRAPGTGAGTQAGELAVLSRTWPTEGGKPIQLTASRAGFFETGGGAFEAFAAVCAILGTGAALVLLIGCINLTNLIAARNSGREREVALRLALGASRWRLVRQFCTESLVLGVLGGAAGLLLSGWLSKWLGVRAVELVDQITNGALGVSLDLTPDWHVMAWTAGLAILTGIAVGVAPALRASTGNSASGLKGRAGNRRNVLLTCQVASCLILLSAAGLLFRGASRSEEIDPRFDWRHLAVVGMDTRTIARSGQARLLVQREALEKMRGLAGIRSVAWADRPPFLGTGSGPFQNEKGAVLGCVFNGVSAGYFATVGIPLLAGRTFTEQEIEQQPPVALISEAAAKRFWPGEEALGRRIAPAAGWLKGITGHESFTVIGVVKSVRSTYLSKPDEGYVYLPRALHDANAMFLVRTVVQPDRFFNAIATGLAGVDTNLPARTYIVGLEDGPVRIQELMAKAPATAAAVLGGLALVFACLGVYGVVAYRVARRMREIGIRMAVGATPKDVIGMVGSETLRPVAWGAVAGLLGAFGVSAGLRTLIVMPDVPDLTYGAGAFDPLTFFGALGILSVMVVLGAGVPLRRATLVDPAVALRNE